MSFLPFVIALVVGAGVWGWHQASVSAAYEAAEEKAVAAGRAKQIGRLQANAALSRDFDAAREELLRSGAAEEKAARAEALGRIAWLAERVAELESAEPECPAPCGDECYRY